jgi:hypothetical protein
VQAVTSSGNPRRQITRTINIETKERADATIDSSLVLRCPSRFGGRAQAASLCRMRSAGPSQGLLKTIVTPEDFAPYGKGWHPEDA